MPGEVEHELFVALGLARTTLARHAYALVAAGAAHLHEGSLGDGVEVWRTLVEVLQERGCRARVQSAGAERGCRSGGDRVGGLGAGVLSGCRVQSDCKWLQGGFRVVQVGASLLCKALCCRLAVEPVYQLERVDGHEYPAGERVDLVLGEA